MWSSVISIWRRYGLRGIACKVRDKALRVMGLDLQQMDLLAHRIEERPDEHALPPYRELFWEDFERHRGDDPAWFTEEKMAKIARWFRPPGTRAFGCFVEGRLVAYGWTSECYLGYSKRTLREEDGYLWDGYTHPDFRGQGWHGALIRIREEELRRAGKRRALTLVADFNRASRRGFQRDGYTPLERCCFGRRWGRAFSTMTYPDTKN